MSGYTSPEMRYLSAHNLSLEFRTCTILKAQALVTDILKALGELAVYGAEVADHKVASRLVSAGADLTTIGMSIHDESAKGGAA